MSQSQCDATALLCRLLDSTKPEINGLTLCSGEHANAGQQLLRERVLVIGTPLDGDLLRVRHRNYARRARTGS
jgi:hypothetical protein